MIYNCIVTYLALRGKRRANKKRGDFANKKRGDFAPASSTFEQHIQIVYIGARGAGDKQRVVLLEQGISVVIRQALSDGLRACLGKKCAVHQPAGRIGGAVRAV